MISLSNDLSLKLNNLVIYSVIFFSESGDAKDDQAMSFPRTC